MALTATELNIIEQAEKLAPGIVRRPITSHIAAFAPFLIGLSLFVWMCISINLSPAAFMGGLDKLGDFFGNMFPPSSGNALNRILYSLLQTFGMAFAGTSLAILAAIPLGLIGAKNIVSFPPLHFTIRRVFDFFRGVPALVWALFLVAAFGMGPFPGVIALALAETPVLAKLYAEALENVDSKQAEGLRASGGSQVQVLRYAVLPQVLPIIVSQGLFYLETNFRNAAVLGVVGAGGIGFELEERIRIFAFDQVAFIILLYMIAVAALDTISGWLRTRLI